MPTSTVKGFSVSNWESNYLRCRYRAHRNKIAAAKPAIDSGPPQDRPHVQVKLKKALNEEWRQAWIFKENLRILATTAEIMNKVAAVAEDQIAVKDSRRKSSSKGIPTPPSRPITVVARRNNHVVLQWFLRKFGKDVPWWARVSY